MTLTFDIDLSEPKYADITDLLSDILVIESEHIHI